jgi:phosphoribosylaminoimidazole-succinocarboxamide synthase
VSSLIFQFLEGYHIPTHFVDVLKPDEMLVKKLEIIPIQLRVWNYVTGSLSKRFGAEKGSALACPIVEINLKDDKLKNPMITMDHVCAFGYGDLEEIQNIDRTVRKINAVLKSFFDRRKLKLVDFHIEFGRFGDQILVGDEISPDNCSFYFIEEGEIESKTCVPKESSDLEATLEELKNRICP